MITDSAPSNPTTVTLTLLVDLVDSTSSAEDTMTINVYSDACKAKIAAGYAEEYDPGDVNLDCITDLRDLAISSAKWLSEYELDEPAVKP